MESVLRARLVRWEALLPALVKLGLTKTSAAKRFAKSVLLDIIAKATQLPRYHAHEAVIVLKELAWEQIICVLSLHLGLRRTWLLCLTARIVLPVCIACQRGLHPLLVYVKLVTFAKAEAPIRPLAIIQKVTTFVLLATIVPREACPQLNVLPVATRRQRVCNRLRTVHCAQRVSIVR